MARPLKAVYANTTYVNGVQEMSDADILNHFGRLIVNYMATYPASVPGAYLRVNNTAANGQLVGTINDQYTSVTGTHGGDPVAANVSYSFYQTGQTTISVSDIYRPVTYDKVGDEFKIRPMSNTEIQDYILKPILANAVQGNTASYALATSAPSPGTWSSVATLINRYWNNTTSATDTYYLYRRTDTIAADANPIRPLKLRSTAPNPADLEEMQDVDIEHWTRLVAPTISSTGVGGYYVGTSVPGTGTWVELGSYGDSVNDITPQNYIGSYQSIYTGIYVNTYTGVYAGSYNTSYTGAFSGAYTRAYTGTYTRAYAGSYSGITFTRAYSGGYTRAYAGAYNQTWTGEYSGAFSGSFAGGYGGGAFTQAYSGTWTGGYTRAYAAVVYYRGFAGPGYYRGVAKAPFYRGVNAYNNTYSGGYQTNYTRAYGTAAFTQEYTRAYAGTYVRNFARQVFYRGFGGPAYYRGFAGPAYYRGIGYFAQYWTGSYTAGYTNVYVDTNTYTGSYTQEFNNSFTGGYVGTYSGNYSATYTGAYNLGYTGTYTGLYNTGYVGSYNTSYTGLYNNTFTRAYTGNYTGAYSRAYTGGYTRAYTGAYSGLTVLNTLTTTTYKLYARVA